MSRYCTMETLAANGDKALIIYDQQNHEAWLQVQKASLVEVSA